MYAVDCCTHCPDEKGTESRLCEHVIVALTDPMKRGLKVSNESAMNLSRCTH